MPPLFDIVTARRARLRAWIADHYQGVQRLFIDATGINQGELSGLLNAKSFGEKRARKLELQAGMPHNFLVSPLDDATRSADDTTQPPQRSASRAEIARVEATISAAFDVIERANAVPTKALVIQCATYLYMNAESAADMRRAETIMRKALAKASHANVSFTEPL